MKTKFILFIFMAIFLAVGSKSLRGGECGSVINENGVDESECEKKISQANSLFNQGKQQEAYVIYQDLPSSSIHYPEAANKLLDWAEKQLAAGDSQSAFQIANIIQSDPDSDLGKRQAWVLRAVGEKITPRNSTPTPKESSRQPFQGGFKGIPWGISVEDIKRTYSEKLEGRLEDVSDQAEVFRNIGTLKIGGPINKKKIIVALFGNQRFSSYTIGENQPGQAEYTVLTFMDGKFVAAEVGLGRDCDFTYSNSNAPFSIFSKTKKEVLDRFQNKQGVHEERFQDMERGENHRVNSLLDASSEYFVDHFQYRGGGEIHGPMNCESLCIYILKKGVLETVAAVASKKSEDDANSNRDRLNEEAKRRANHF